MFNSGHGSEGGNGNGGGKPPTSDADIAGFVTRACLQLRRMAAQAS
jgi:hypothetical protein